jgi:phospholipid/cholesterol/gamma-HCH transport system permease protein
MASLSPDRAHQEAAWLTTEQHNDVVRLVAGGDWIISQLSQLDRELRALPASNNPVEIDGSALKRLDSAGAWLLLRTRRQMEAEGTTVQTVSVPERFKPLIEIVARDDEKSYVIQQPMAHPFLFRVGRGFMQALEQGYNMLGYLGQVTAETTNVIGPQKKLRLVAFANQIEQTGINALPIVGLLGFLIGIVLAYQGADQLRQFGAEIFTINLLGVGILREIGVLITSIIVAGRSGSAFTAQIGTMRVNEEIDAMQTMGLNTVDVLVLPRVLALVITLPFLTFYADIMAMIGGAMMCYLDLGISIPAFMRQLQGAVTINTFIVGLVKAPVFAFVIGLVGCFEGLNVERNAGSVGRLTTRSVVESVFLVIVLDAGFSIMFSILGI